METDADSNHESDIANGHHGESLTSVATVASLRPFFQPKAVAIVGASNNHQSIGYRLLDAVIRGGYSGLILPVNPTTNSVCGLTAYPSVRDLPHQPDLVVIAVPCDAVLTVVDDCAARGVRAIVVITAGFAEAGKQGQQLQQRLLAKVRAHGMRMVGPNCLGLVTQTTHGQLDATFVSVFPPKGRVAMSSDSGALGMVGLVTAARMKLGLSQCVCVGNRADVSSNDLLEYWENDAATDVIVLYLESFGNPRRFARIARRVSRRKPIVAMKAGRTAGGSRAAGSHTAALAANDVAVDALFRQTGVIRADTTQELFDLATALANQPMPRGRRVGMVTNAGGPAVLCTDACETAGLLVPEFSDALKSSLAAKLPAIASVRNPVDMIASASAEDFGRTVATLLLSNEIDMLIAIYLDVGVTTNEQVTQQIQDAVAWSRQKTPDQRPVLLCFMPELTSSQLAGSAPAQLPCFPHPETPAIVLGKLAAYAEWRDQPLGSTPTFADIDIGQVRAVCHEAAQPNEQAWLTTENSRRVLQAMHLPIASGGVAHNIQEALALARTVGFPLAVKLASHRLMHKTELGGVHLNVASEDELERAFHDIRSRLAAMHQLDAMDGVLIQRMVSGGTEVMIGVTHDPLFGPLIAFGLGGIHVEILRDVVFRVAPLTNCDAAAMVRAIRGFRLLQGYRGHAPADVAALEEALLRVSRLVEEVPDIVELDLNPVFALPPGQGCRIVDARIRVAPR